jgi:proteic killer suppression protein
MECRGRGEPSALAHPSTAAAHGYLPRSAKNTLKELWKTPWRNSSGSGTRGSRSAPDRTFSVIARTRSRGAKVGQGDRAERWGIRTHRPARDSRCIGADYGRTKARCPCPSMYSCLPLITFHGSIGLVIRSFRCRETARVWQGEFSRRLPQDIQVLARRKLRMLNNAQSLGDLRVPPRNCLEALAGDREGQHSIRINDQWRLCFRWQDADAFDVEIVDYH